MGRWKWLLLGLLAVVIILALVQSLKLVASRQPSLPESDQAQNKNWDEARKGVGFHTKNSLASDLRAANEIGLVFLNAAAVNGRVPQIIKLGFEGGHLDFPVPNMAGDAKDPDGLKRAYLELVRDYQPVLIGLGNEIERMADRDEFVRIYPDLYAAVKAECPYCVVYPVFQYEAFDAALARQLPLDLLVFTSYPFARYSSVSSIPSDYYAAAGRVARELGVEVGFTEIGWPTLEPFSSGSPDVQSAFYRRFLELTSDLNLRFVSWGLLYGAASAGPEWADMGVLDDSGQRKPLFETILNSNF
jgi:hypothetical protein